MCKVKQWTGFYMIGTCVMKKLSIICTDKVLQENITAYITQKMIFSVKDFFIKCEQIRNFPQIWSHLLNEFLMKSYIFEQSYNAGIEILLSFVSGHLHYLILVNSFTKNEHQKKVIVRRSQCTLSLAPGNIRKPFGTNGLTSENFYSSYIHTYKHTYIHT